MARQRITVMGERLSVTQLARKPLSWYRALDPDAAARVRRFAGLQADWGARTWDRQDGWAVVEKFDQLELKDPADPGDVRFELLPIDEDGGRLVLTIDDKGVVCERNYFARAADAGAMIQATREHQDLVKRADEQGVHPLELAFAPFGEEWQREQEER
jgi:hypothetical protein